MIYLYIFIVFYIIKTIIVYRLRKKRNNINLTTQTGKLKCKRINETIDILTGGWIFKLKKSKYKG